MSDALRPDWPAPANVGALLTTRACAVLRPERVRGASGDMLPVQYLDQHHSAQARTVKRAGAPLRGDALHTRTPGLACAVQGADCLMTLLCDRAGSEVAAAHAGWRGLAAGALEATLEGFRAKPRNLIAWLGPVISAPFYEVGGDVRAAFEARESCFFEPIAGSQERFLADLRGIAKQRLELAGVGLIADSSLCTWRDNALFYSWRREQNPERHAAVVWLEP